MLSMTSFLQDQVYQGNSSEYVVRPQGIAEKHPLPNPTVATTAAQWPGKDGLYSSRERIGCSCPARSKGPARFGFRPRYRFCVNLFATEIQPSQVSFEAPNTVLGLDCSGRIVGARCRALNRFP